MSVTCGLDNAGGSYSEVANDFVSPLLDSKLRIREIRLALPGIIEDLQSCLGGGGGCNQSISIQNIDVCGRIFQVLSKCSILDKFIFGQSDIPSFSKSIGYSKYGATYNGVDI